MKSAGSGALVNINTGAVGLTATVVAAGIATAFIWKVLNKDHRGYAFKTGHFPYARSGNYQIYLFNFLISKHFEGFSNSFLRDLQIKKLSLSADSCNHKVDIHHNMCAHKAVDGTSGTFFGCVEKKKLSFIRIPLIFVCDLLFLFNMRRNM